MTARNTRAHAHIIEHTPITLEEYQRRRCRTVTTLSNVILTSFSFIGCYVTIFAILLLGGAP